jgi:hypothetical protein
MKFYRPGGSSGFCAACFGALKCLPDEQIDAVCQFPWSFRDVDVKEELLEFMEDLVFFKMIVGLVNEFRDVGTIRRDEAEIGTDHSRRGISQEGGEESSVIRKDDVIEEIDATCLYMVVQACGSKHVIKARRTTDVGQDVGAEAVVMNVEQVVGGADIGHKVGVIPKLLVEVATENDLLLVVLAGHMVFL